MNRIKSLSVVFLVILVLLALVLNRSCDQNLFKQNANTAIEATANNSNLVTSGHLRMQTNPFLVVNLGDENMPDSLWFEKTIHLQFKNLLDQSNKKILKEVNGDLILYSSDEAIAAKAWVILNQLGYKNVFILSSEANPEVLKYKFQPDTTARLEHDTE